MNTFARLALLLLLTVGAHAQIEQVQITARYEGFDPARFPEFKPPHAGNGKDLLNGANVTTKSGNRAVIEIIKENEIPEPGNGEKTVLTGITLDVSPLVKDGQIALSGKSTVRYRVPSKQKQPLGATSFVARETYFNGLIENGAELSIQVGDNDQDKTRIILTVRRIDAQGQAKK